MIRAEIHLRGYHRNSITIAA